MNSPFNLSRKYNTIAAIIGGTLLATILISVFLIRPTWAKLKTLGQEVPAEQQKRNDSERQLAGLEQAKTYFQDDKEIVDQVNIAVPIDPQIPQILLILEQLARDNKVRLTSFQPQTTGGTVAQSGQAQGAVPAQPTTGGGAAVAGNPVEITANFEGSYASLISFFYTLERSLRLIDVKSITVSNGGSTSSSSTAMTGAITFTAYYKQVEGSQPVAGAK